MPAQLTLSALELKLAVCRLGGDEAIPAWATASDFFSVTRTSEELSIVCPHDRVPPGVRKENRWRALMVHGPLDFALVGVLAALATPLSLAGISLFALSTYDTDYLLVKEEDLQKATDVLTEAGHTVL